MYQLIEQLATQLRVQREEPIDIGFEAKYLRVDGYLTWNEQHNNHKRKIKHSV